MAKEKDKTKDDAPPKLDAAESKLVSFMEENSGGVMKDMPDGAKSALRIVLGMLARSIAGWVGTGSRNITWKIASKHTDARNAERWATTGDMVGRSLITTVLPNIKSAYTLVKDSLDRRKQFKHDFAGLDASLEVVRYEAKLNSEATSLKTKGFFKSFIAQAIPDALVNALSMSAKGVKDYTDYHGLKRLEKENNLDSKERKALKELEDTRKKWGPAAEFRDDAAKKILERADKLKFIPGMPGDEGMTNQQNLIFKDLASIVPGDHGDFTEGEGRGRGNYISFLVTSIGYGYELFSKRFLSKIFVDKFTPKAKALLTERTAGQMIKALEEPFAGDAAPTRLSIKGHKNQNCLVGDYIFDVFIQHRSSMGFQALSELTKESLQEACDVIAAAMQDGNRRLSPKALAYLIDSKQGIITYKDGKVSGVKSGDELEEAIQSLISDKGLTGKPFLKIAEYYKDPEKENDSNVRFTRDEMLESWESLSKEEQQVWSTNFPDEVLQDITGDKTYARKLRMSHNDLWKDMFEETYLAVGALSQKEKENAGITSTMQRQLDALVKDIKRDPNTGFIENQTAIMQLTAELGIRLNAENPGFISDMVAHAQERKASQPGLFRDRVEHEEEQTHFRDKVGKREKPEIAVRKSDPVKEILGDEAKTKRGDHRHGKRHEEEAVERHA